MFALLGASLPFVCFKKSAALDFSFGLKLYAAFNCWLTS